MTPARYRQVRQIILDVVDRPANERAEILQRHCRDDDDLRLDVESLLAYDEPSHDALDPGLPELPLSVFAGEGLQLQPGGLPERIGSYRIIEVLGHGGMGTVYRAQQADPAREVALKLMRPRRHSAAAIGRFRKEARILGALDHPGIVPILEAGSFDDGVTSTPFLVMPLITGQPLLTYADDRRLGIPARVELLATICDAVTFAHQRAVIHRDLKPANILVGDDGQPRILDFGIARIADGDDDDTGSMQTMAGEILGTLSYMSPEQATGTSGDLDVRSDVYALGVIGYQLLSGRLPIDVRDLPVVEAIRRIDGERPPRLRMLDPRLGRDLETVIGKALEKDRERRYASVAELAADLRRCLASQPVTARPPSFGYHLSCLVRRHRRPVAAASLATVLLVATSIVATAGWIQVHHTSRLMGALYQSEVATLIDMLPPAPFPMEPESPAVSEQLAPLRAAAIGSDADVAALRALADELQQRSNGELRDAPGLAFAHRLESLQLRSRITQLEPQRIEHYEALSIGIVLVGDVYADAGHRIMPAHCYRVSLAIDEALLRLRPDDVRLRDNRFWSYRRMWSNAQWNGDFALAERYRQRLLPEAEQIVASDAGDPVRYRALMEALELESRHSADMSTRLELLQLAVTAGQRSIQIGGGQARELLRQVQTLCAMHRELVRAERFNDAELVLDDLDVLLDRVAALTGAELDVRSERALVLRLRSRLHQLAKRWDESIRWGRRALEATDRSNLVAQRNLHQQMARSCAALGRDDDARGHTETMLRLARDVARRPASPIAEIACYARLLLSPPAPEFRDPPTALAVAERAVRLSHGVHPGAVEALARAQLASGDTAAAAATLRGAIATLGGAGRWLPALEGLLESIDVGETDIRSSRTLDSALQL